MPNDAMQQATENIERFARRDRLFLNNPVIMQGLGLAPLIVANTTVKNAVMLSVAVFLLLIPTRVVAATVSRFTFYRFRGMMYALVASVVYIGVYWVMSRIFPAADIALLGLYLPLLVMDPIVLKRYERPQREEENVALKKGFITAAGYALALLVVAAVREIIGMGTFYGLPVFKSDPLPMAILPAGGFMLLAVIMAVWRGAVYSFKKQMNMEAKQV